MVSSPACYWFTGLSGAGKTSIAERVASELRAIGVRSIVLDGDQLRSSLNCDLGYSRADRHENARRITEVAKLFYDAGMIVLVASISPYASDRANARRRFPEGSFFEVYVSTSVEVCIRRDPKGLYKKSLMMEHPHFTGLDAPYELPVGPDFIIETEGYDVAHSAQAVLRHVTGQANV